MSPSDLFMAADVFLVVTFQFLTPVFFGLSRLNIVLLHFSVEYRSEIYMLSWVFLGVTETDTFVLFCGYR